MYGIQGDIGTGQPYARNGMIIGGPITAELKKVLIKVKIIAPARIGLNAFQTALGGYAKRLTLRANFAIVIASII
jgi:hypothetical protein